MAGYTFLTFPDIKRLLSFYDLGRLLKTEQMKGGQANSSYKVNTEKGVFILSVCDEKNAEEVDCLTRILSHLNQNNFPTSRPIQALDGKLLIQHEDKPVYIKEYIDGVVVQDLSEQMLFQVGQVVSDLHSIPPLAIIPDRFPYGLESFAELNSYEHPYINWLKERVGFLQQEIDPDMDRGVIHGDMYWDNLLFSGDRLVAVLDFEEACHYYSLYDLGVCVIGCCSDNNGLKMEKARAFLRGYQKDRPLTDHQRTQLKVFIEYAGAAGSFWRFRQYNIRYPAHELKDYYKELSCLADQVHAMDSDKFLEYCQV